MVEEAKDMVSVLTRDHDEVKALFAQIESAADARARRRYADHVTAELVRHSVAEEMYLYPAARDVLPDGDLVDDELEEHAKAENLLKQWEKLDGSDAEFMTVFGQIRESVLHHIEEEEGELFPKLRQHLSTTEMDQLGDRISKAKATAPTRPHPSAPDQPPMDKLLGPPLGIVDRIRDRMSGREIG